MGSAALAAVANPSANPATIENRLFFRMFFLFFPKSDISTPPSTGASFIELNFIRVTSLYSVASIGIPQ
jgi:hypothetical protein